MGLVVGRNGRWGVQLRRACRVAVKTISQAITRSVTAGAAVVNRDAAAYQTFCGVGSGDGFAVERSLRQLLWVCVAAETPLSAVGLSSTTPPILHILPLNLTLFSTSDVVHTRVMANSYSLPGFSCTSLPNQK